MENMYKLNLHDSIKFSESGLYILRVPGGWIYLQDRANSMGTDLMCFVPFNNEFQESELIAPPEQPNNGMELTSAPQSAGSVKYEIALCVFQDYKAFCDECESNYMPFPEFCKKHIDVGA
jgi:hypothetical protein